MELGAGWTLGKTTSLISPHISPSFLPYIQPRRQVPKMAAFFKDILGGAKESVASVASVSDGQFT